MTTQSIRFWDGIADRYASSPIADQGAYEHKLALARRVLRPDMRALEFGCGTGATALAHAPHVASLHATDISPRMIDIARQRLADSDVTNVVFDTEPLDVSLASVPDAVFALNVLHLMPDWRSAIASVHDALAPGGVFISSTACLEDSVFRYIALVAPLARWLGWMPSVEVFGARALVGAMREAGFEIETEWQPGPRKALFVIARKPSMA